MLNRSMMTLAAFSGMEVENMTRGHGWRFLDMGRRLERGQTLTTLLRACCARGNPRRAALWRCSSSPTAS